LWIKSKVIYAKIYSQLATGGKTMQSTNKTTYAAVPFVIFGIILITAFFLKYFEPMLPDVLQNWAEHLSIALIVAVVIGLTYEYTSHLFREEILKNLLHESQEQVYQALKAYSVLTPDEVFRLLKEIASQINQTLLCFIHLDRKATNARLQKIWIFSTRLSK
jgi:hypothetical protein